MKISLNNAYRILALDSIYNVLPWTDRIRLHLAINERQELAPTPAIIAAHEYIIRQSWTPPEVRHLKDNDGLFVFYGNNWLTIEEYRELKPIKIT